MRYSTMETSSQTQPVLVLDAGGVLLADAFREGYWRYVASVARCPESEVMHRYREEIRVKLWTGIVEEGAFFQWLIESFSLPGNVAQWRSLLHQMFKPTPASQYLHALAERYRVVILSNHRHEWLRPALERQGMMHHVERVFVSDELGLMKPNENIYKEIESVYPLPLTFVDDQSINLEIPTRRGWQTVQADADGRWAKDLLENFV